MGILVGFSCAIFEGEAGKNPKLGSSFVAIFLLLFGIVVWHAAEVEVAPQVSVATKVQAQTMYGPCNKALPPTPHDPHTLLEILHRPQVKVETLSALQNSP